jgi:nitrile hydratase subunit beta
VSYREGQRVRVAARPHEGHHRTPGYVKGKVGTVERMHRAFANPETLAYGGDGLPEQALYLVGFRQDDLLPGDRGRSSDRIYVDVFEHWLEAAE